MRRLSTLTFARRRLSAQADLDAFIADAWLALKQECCVNPTTAVRCVMVPEEKFRAALAKVLEPCGD